MSPLIRWISLSVVAIAFAIWLLTPLRRPTDSRMVGEYEIALAWGEASLSLHADHTFTEFINPRSGAAHEVHGKWSLRPGWQAGLIVEPFWHFTQDEQGVEAANADLPVETWGVTGVRLEFGDVDSGITLRKR